MATATMSHFAIQQFTKCGMKSPHSIRVSIVATFSLRCNDRTVYPASISMEHRRRFMNSTASDASGGSGVTPERILNQCSELYDSLSTLNEKLGGMAIPKSSPHTRCVQNSLIRKILSRDHGNSL